MTTNRRAFMKSNVALSAIAALSNFATLANVAPTEDYRALVCIFMLSGNDGNNMIVPRDPSDWTTYSGAPAFQTVFTGSNLGDALKMVARLISVRKIFGAKRQVYFAGIGGFDTHGEDQMQRQQELLGEVSGAMTAFYNATNELGLSENVTAFTASDFNRNFPTNGRGSDHAWGSHHMVVGGAVKGNAMYGKFPTLIVDGPDDANNGSWIPTTSVDQYAATLAAWFGVPSTELNLVFPNLNKFATANLAFMT